jgi:hypothetical protein
MIQDWYCETMPALAPRQRVRLNAHVFDPKNTFFARFCAHFALVLYLLALMQPDLSPNFVRLQPVNFEN